MDEKREREREREKEKEKERERGCDEDQRPRIGIKFGDTWNGAPVAALQVRTR